MLVKKTAADHRMQPLCTVMAHEGNKIIVQDEEGNLLYRLGEPELFPVGNQVDIRGFSPALESGD